MEFNQSRLNLKLRKQGYVNWSADATCKIRMDVDIFSFVNLLSMCWEGVLLLYLIIMRNLQNPLDSEHSGLT